MFCKTGNRSEPFTHHAGRLLPAITMRTCALPCLRYVFCLRLHSLSLQPVRQIVAHRLIRRPREARDIFKQLIEINTTDTPKGSVTAAAEAMQKRFLDAGFAPEDVHLLGPDPEQAEPRRAHARGRRPRRKSQCCSSAIWTWSRLCRSDWHTNPFEFVEKDGYFYGRGTQDMKESDAALVVDVSSPASRRLQAEARSHPGPHRR